jgi:hypothetical protein
MEALSQTDRLVTVPAPKKIRKNFKKNILCPFDGC